MRRQPLLAAVILLFGYLATSSLGPGESPAPPHDIKPPPGVEATLDNATAAFLTALLMKRSSVSEWLGSMWYTSSLRYMQKSDSLVMDKYVLNADQNPFLLTESALFAPFYARREELEFVEGRTYTSVLKYNFTTYSTSGINKMVSAMPPACEALAKMQRAKIQRKYFPMLNTIACRRYPFGNERGLDWRHGEYNLLQNIAVYNGDLYSTDGETKVFEWCGHFTAIRGLVFQPVDHHIKITPLPANVTLNESARISLGVYQPPVDYHTLWHVIVETMMPLFHSVLPYLVRGEHDFTIIQPPPSAARPYTLFSKATRDGLIDTKTENVSCMMSGKRCLETKLGVMMSQIFAKGRFHMENNVHYAIPVTRMMVGHPSNCMPVFAGDGVIQAATGHLSEECAKFLWLWRAFWLKEYNIPWSRPFPVTTPISEIYVLWASRKGDWARDIVNEDAVIGEMRGWGVYVDVTKFAMPMKEQYTLLQKATHFVAPHGAALLNAVMLKPRAVFISIDILSPPFTSLVMEIPWIHRFHFKGDLVCNKKHPTNRNGRCEVFLRHGKARNKNNAKTSEHNNNIHINQTNFLQMFNSTLMDLDHIKQSLYNVSEESAIPANGSVSPL